MSPKRQLVAVDLFSGCGGLTRGLKDAEFQVLGAVELNPLAVETYALNHPEVRVWEGDIWLIDPSEVKRELGLRRRELDLLAACPPCQGFSSMRTLNGQREVNDPRNNLIFRVAEFVEALLPKAVMIENVPGLANDYRLGLLLEVLCAFGYSCKWKIDDASRYGVPQRRKRFILIASRKGEPVFPEPQRDVLTVRDAISELPEPGCSQDPLHDAPARRSAQVMELIRQIPRDGGSRAALPVEAQLACHRNCDGFKDVYGRMRWDEVSPTITGGCINPSKGRFLHPDQDRAITLREAALLQSFPNDYQFSLARGTYPVAEMIGNALPPRFIRAHASEIARQLGSKSSRRTHAQVIPIDA